MRNFEYYNPTRIIFGKGSIAKLAELVHADAKPLLMYGGGSIKRNGVYDQAMAALDAFEVVEFGGVEPNPQYDTCMKAVTRVNEEECSFLLAVGGGSVLDACKFVAAAARYKGDDAWDILKKWAPVEDAIPLGAILTLPATGSEMNAGSVISREETSEKLFFGSDLVRPVFSILDPETTYSLPPIQTANGIVDAFIHAVEQYATYRAPNPLQDRQAEAILKTLIEEGPKALEEPKNYEVRANIMWCATNALNGWLSLGVPTDWAAHVIGHELTALYGVDHGTSLAIVEPGVWEHQRDRKKDKLLQYAERVWGIADGSESERISKAIAQTDLFFRSLGIGTKLRDHNIPEEACELVAKRLANRDMKIGEPELPEEGAYPAMPHNEYGWEKLYAERTVMAYGRRYKFPVRIARFQNCYGPEGTWRGGREKAPAAMCRKIAEAADGGTIEIWGDGTAVRSYTYIDDLIDGIYLLMQSDLEGAVNIGRPEYVSVNELVAAVSDVAGKRVKVKHIEGPVGVESRNFANTRIYSTGWRSQFSLRDGIARTYPWIKVQVEQAAAKTGK